MNTPIFPIATVLIATAPTSSDQSGLIGVAQQYGLPGLMILALGAFAVWQEKKRNNREDASLSAREERDEKDRAERKEQHDSLIALIREKDATISELTDWIKGQAERS